ncbi:MAG TPA: hypothetical protein VFD04_08790 [Actinomycetes bacterium]|nr:hypothetical protein [Actinomycetes bacterium]
MRAARVARRREGSVHAMRGQREEGVTTVGYALVVAIVALLLVTGFVLLFNSVPTRFERTSDCVSAPDGTGCPMVTSATGP